MRVVFGWAVCCLAKGTRAVPSKVYFEIGQRAYKSVCVYGECETRAATGRLNQINKMRGTLRQCAVKLALLIRVFTI